MRKRCKRCGRFMPSKRKKEYCFDCGLARVIEAAKQLKSKEGELYQRWLFAYQRFLKLRRG